MRSPQLKNVEDIKNRRIGHQRELPWCNDDDDEYQLIRLKTEQTCHIAHQPDPNNTAW